MWEAIFRWETAYWLMLFLYVPCCVGLIVVVLLQKGKGVGFAGAFGLGGASDTVFEDSICVSNTGWGVATYGTVTVTTDYNDVWDNDEGSYDNTGKIVVGANSISSDPLFDDAANDDFHIDQDDSPCVDAASDGADMGYRFEYETDVMN